MIERGDLQWADLGPAQGSRPAKRRPVLIIQANSYNSSRLATVVVAVVTSNVALAAAPGNTFLPASTTGLPRDSVVNATALLTVNKTDLSGKIGAAPASLMEDVNRGLNKVLGL